MVCEKFMVDILSERDSLVAPVTIKEEFKIMSVGSSSMLKEKRRVQRPNSPP